MHTQYTYNVNEWTQVEQGYTTAGSYETPEFFNEAGMFLLLTAPNILGSLRRTGTNSRHLVYCMDDENEIYELELLKWQ